MIQPPCIVGLPEGEYQQWEAPSQRAMVADKKNDKLLQIIYSTIDKL